MTAGASAAIAAMAEQLFREHWPSSAEVYLGGGVPAPGPRFANPALAATYQRILDEAEAAGGGPGQADRGRPPGLLRGLRGRGHRRLPGRGRGHGRHRRAAPRRCSAGPTWPAGRPAWNSRPRLDFRGLTVCKTGPWGQGPVFLQQLALLDGLGLGSLAPGSADFIHAVIECAKLAFADREAWYGDPRFAAVPLDGPALGGLRGGAPGAGRRAGVRWSCGRAARRPAAAAARLRAPGRRGGPPGPARSRPSRPRKIRRGHRAALGGDRAGRAGAARPATIGRHGRHLPPGRGRPVRQPGVGHPERRLAAELAGHPGAGVLPGHPGPDVHPDRGAAQHAGPGQAAADHADAQPGAARRPAVPGVRHARRGPAGPVDAGVLPQPRGVRDEPPGGHRLSRPSTPTTSRRRSTRGRPRRGRSPWRAGPASR